MNDSKMTLDEMVQYGLLDAIADGLLVCDLEGTIWAMNRRFEELSDYQSSDLIGQSVEVLVPELLRGSHETHRADFVRSGLPTRPMGSGLETQLLTRSGRAFPVDISLARLELKSQTLVVTAVRDATEHIRREQSIQGMREVIEAILRGQPVQAIYRLICRKAVGLLSASVALVAVRAPNGEHGFEVEAAAGAGAEELTGRLLVDDVLEMAVATDSRTFADAGSQPLSDLLGHAIGPTAIFPLPEGQRLGFLLVTDDPGRSAFDAEGLETLESFASQAGLAFAYGRRLRALAVAGDRDRIARDLHDLIIQRLFGAGLSLQVAAQLYAGDSPELPRRLEEVIDSLDLVIAELRRSIFDLERKNQLDLRDRVLIVIEEVLAEQDLRTVVKVDEVMTEPSEEIISNLLATLREALSNTVRHASATRVDISLSVGSEVVMVVSDDGVGMGESSSMGHGLSNMAERARRLGGELTISNMDQGGLALAWQIPL